MTGAMKLKGFLVFWMLVSLFSIAFAKGGGGGHGGGGHGGGHASSGHASSHSSSHGSNATSHTGARPAPVVPPARGNGCSDESRKKGNC